MAAVSFNRKDRASVDSLRLLAADMVEKARSGHPGLPLGAAPMAYVLLTRFLKHNPQDPQWPDRDRFILSAGHGSALLYAWLHLAGYGLSLEELKNFRQWRSRTPGHPEYGHTPGVEATTGPLGQGLSMAVGLALAETMLAQRFNRPGFELFNHYTYALVSDGDLMEGVSSEAASLAGTLGLGKLIYLYDDNQITIEGHTSLAFTEDVRGRFLAYGWQVIPVADGENLAAIHQAIENARAEKEKPSLIMVKTRIGAGSPKENSPAAHGEPLGEEALAATRRHYGYPEDQSFTLDERVTAHFLKWGAAHQGTWAAWNTRLEAYKRDFSAEAAELQRRLRGETAPPPAIRRLAFNPDQPLATRTASGRIMNALAAELPELAGGSADLAPSNKTFLADQGSYSLLARTGRNIHFGVREAAMGAIVNGLALAGGFFPFGATFLVFSDYLKPALRLAALMKLKNLFIFTHDSIGVGEDGPTHQPVEQLLSLRAVPGLTVFRPADAYECLAAWEAALTGAGPLALILSRQNLPVLSPERFPAVSAGPAHGAYILSEAEGGRPEALIMASGSETHLALAAQKLLAERGRRVRVVSFPSWELFERQSAEYQNEVLPAAVPRRLAVEAGRGFGWERYAGPQGRILSMEDFGVSAPADQVFREFGFTPENIADLLMK